MKRNQLIVSVFLILGNFIYGQQWMRSLAIAQDLAMVQNKMVLMVWEEATQYQYPVIIEDENGRKLFIRDLFTDENISPIIWDYFVPVIVSDDDYEKMYLEFKGRRKQSYIDKFNDDSIKIMDVNGQLLNTKGTYEWYENITRIIEKYALHTEFLNAELRSYHEKKDIYSAYFLASKYLDFSLFVNELVREEILDLAEVYIVDANYILDLIKTEEKRVLRQRLELLEIQKELISKRPRTAIRRLKRMGKDGYEDSNMQMISFLFYTANMCLDRQDDAGEWKSTISSLNLKKAQKIINLNN